MSDETYAIRVNQFTNGATGHTNITYISSSGTFVTYGNNSTPSVGVQNETSQTLQRIADYTSSYSYVDIQVTQAQFNQSLAVSQASDLLNNNYFGLCNNCADFANEALKAAGMGDWALANYLRDGTLTDTYIQTAQYICSNTYVDLATSNLLNVLASTQNVSDAVNFVNAMSWLADHENGSDFYQTYYSMGEDPDVVADAKLAQLKYYATKLGISVDYDPIEEKVTLGVASPVVIDLNGDGIQTTSYSAHSVAFDIDGDGVKDRTAWISGQDAFLAIDSDENGQIDGSNELFGGLSRGDGYAKLADFDSNADGFLNKDDERYTHLKVWQDVNMNGVTDAGELKSAASVGLDSISVIYKSQDIYQNNNLIGEVSNAIVNGQTVEAADIYFKFKSGAVNEVAFEPERISIGSQVDALISAMAAFAPPTAGHATLPADYQTALTPVIAANCT